MLDLTKEKQAVANAIYRHVHNNGRRVRGRKQATIGRELNDCRRNARDPRWAAYVPQNVSDAACIQAAQQVSAHKGPWCDSLRRPLQIIACWEVANKG